VVGRSMANNVKMALKMGYLDVPEGVLVSTRDASRLPHERVVIVATGSQGEPTSALVRIANGEHRDVEVVPGDTVIISASPIPGNETLISKTIDRLFMHGARDTDTSPFSQAFQTGRDVDPISVNTLILNHHVADVDTHAVVHLSIFWKLGVSYG